MKSKKPSDLLITDLQREIGTVELFNLAELKHIAVNYALHSLNGYTGSFDDWFKNIAPEWRRIANSSKRRV